MLELAVAAACRFEVPTIFVEQSKYFNHFHGLTVALAPVSATCESTVIRYNFAAAAEQDAYGLSHTQGDPDQASPSPR